jgi:hypothetical protein
MTHYKFLKIQGLMALLLCLLIGCKSSEEKKPIPPNANSNKVDPNSLLVDLKGSNNLAVNFQVGFPEKNNGLYCFTMKMEKFGDGISAIDTAWCTKELEKGFTVFLKRVYNVPFESSQNATYAYQDDDFRLVKEIQGTEIDTSKLRLSLRGCLKGTLTKLDLNAQGLYVKPKINSTSQELFDAKSQLDACLSTKIVLKRNGATFQLNKKDFATWLGLNDKLKVDVDRFSVQNFVQKIASQIEKPYSELLEEYLASESIDSTAEITFPRMNIDKEVDEIIRNIISGKSASREIIFIERGLPQGIRKGFKDFVEVSITEQKLWLFKAGHLILETDVVTGNERLKRTTPTGDYKVYAKQLNRTLRGPGYSSFVKYWMPFFRGYGLHDANWRSRFGASIYQSRGSHGCINIPPKVASVVFQNVEVGTPVIIR